MPRPLLQMTVVCAASVLSSSDVGEIRWPVWEEHYRGIRNGDLETNEC